MTRVRAVKKLSQSVAAQKGDCAEDCRGERHSGRTIKSRYTVAFCGELSVVQAVSLRQVFLF